MSITTILGLFGYIKSGADAVDALNKSKILPFFSNAIKEKFDQKKLDEELKNYFGTHSKNNSYLNTIVFQNKPKFIQEIYIPLTLEKNDNPNEKYKLDEDLNIESILSYNRILIVDYAGMGKSTCTKWLYLTCLSSPDFIPFLVELRNLRKDKNVEQLIQEDLNLKHNLFDSTAIHSLLSSNKIVFFLDGLDEIDGENRKDILANLNKFHMKYSQAIFIMTSRPEDFLIGLKGFTRFGLKQFNESEAFKLIRKYDIEKKHAEKMINDIKKSQNDMAIKDFLGNPLSISLLFTSYCYTPQISFNKIQFYDNIFEALYERHDFSKGDSFFRPRHCSLSKNNFLKILCHLGMETCLTLKKVSFSYAELCGVISNSKKFFGIEFDTDLYIKDLKTTIPLIVEDGIYLKWSHKTFQDYYTAYFLKYHYDKKYEILKKISLKSEYYTVLDFYYELDEKGFKQHLLKDELKKIIETRNSILSKVSNKDLANNLTNIFFKNNSIQYYSDLTELVAQKKHREIFDQFQSEIREHFHEWSHVMSALYILGENNKAMITYHASPSFLHDFSMVVYLAVKKNRILEISMNGDFKYKDLNIIERKKLISLTINSFLNPTSEHLLLSEYILGRTSSLNINAAEEEYKNILDMEANEQSYHIKI